MMTQKDKIKELGQLLKRLMDSKGLSGNRLAHLSGIERSYISKILSGKMGNITLDTARKLAIGLGVSPDVFLSEVDNKQLFESTEELLEKLRLATPIAVPVYKDFPVHAGSSMDFIDYVYLARNRSNFKFGIVRIQTNFTHEILTNIHMASV